MLTRLLASKPVRLAGLASAPLALCARPPSACAADSSKSSGSGVGTLLESTPLGSVTAGQMQLLGVSGISGYTAGFAVKRTFRVLIFTTGCIFIGLQSLASNGLISVHWASRSAP